jgi:hypothetical protein
MNNILIPTQQPLHPLIRLLQQLLNMLIRLEFQAFRKLDIIGVGDQAEALLHAACDVVVGEFGCAAEVVAAAGGYGVAAVEDLFGDAAAHADVDMGFYGFFGVGEGVFLGDHRGEAEGASTRENSDFM